MLPHRVGRDVRPVNRRAGQLTVKNSRWWLLAALVLIASSACAGPGVVASAPSSAPAIPAVVTSVPAPAAPAWQLNGVATLAADSLLLTPSATRKVAGSAFWKTAISHATVLNASFDVEINGGTGADGVTLTLADGASARPTSLGGVGGALGWSGIAGLAVALDTFQNPGDPSYNSIGLVTGFDPELPDHLAWREDAINLVPLRNHLRHISVSVRDGILTAAVDGVAAFSSPAALPAQMLIGFTAANGARTDVHVVSNVKISFS